ncbi:MAG: 2,3-bisphosphoglycerate-independent phosphoglycerate mutase, partial [Candidatus Harrisonbacteria bacterium]|nr:2,3-bisphosphoglycerate-independent phosphoglycerate mutase [Candidatus Harrisonbacteria bacterium]
GQIDELIGRMHEQGKNDDFLPPFVFGPQAKPIQSGDSLVFFDYREDSIRQIAASFILKDFDKFQREPLQDLFITTFTGYSEQFKVPVAFPQPDVTAPLGKVLSEAGKTQLLIAETEKYAHATYFFNGYRDGVFEGQFPVLIPSQNVSRHDRQPEMRASEISDRIVQAIEEGSYDFIFANFANAVMVAHTGNFDATLRAVEAVDRALGPIVKACEATGTALMISADHGNAEVVLDPLTGRTQTQHDPNPVPLYTAGKIFDGGRNPSSENAVIGILSDLAPTVLEIMGIEKPREMTGKSLLRLLQQ